MLGGGIWEERAEPMEGEPRRLTLGEAQHEQGMEVGGPVAGTWWDGERVQGI